MSLCSVSCGEPPHVENARMFGTKKLEYPVRSIVRYQCNPGFRQRHSPVVHCQADGLWETPRVECIDGESCSRKYNLTAVLFDDCCCAFPHSQGLEKTRGWEPQESSVSSAEKPGSC